MEVSYLRIEWDTVALVGAIEVVDWVPERKAVSEAKMLSCMIGWNALHERWMLLETISREDAVSVVSKRVVSNPPVAAHASSSLASSRSVLEESSVVVSPFEGDKLAKSKSSCVEAVEAEEAERGRPEEASLFAALSVGLLL